MNEVCEIEWRHESVNLISSSLGKNKDIFILIGIFFLL